MLAAKVTHSDSFFQSAADLFSAINLSFYARCFFLLDSENVSDPSLCNLHLFYIMAGSSFIVEWFVLRFWSRAEAISLKAL